MPDLPTAVLLTRDPELATLAKACVWEAGVAVRHLEWPDQLDALAPTWSLVVCGRDVGADVPQAVKRAWPASTVARVALGAAGGPPGELALPGAWSHLTALAEAAHAPPRAARRVAVVGTHGGAGASCLAVALAREFAKLGPSRLAALNSAGAPAGALLGVTDGAGWVEAVAAVEAGRPPPSRSVAGVELLSPAGPADGVAAWQVRQVIERWETSGGHTVLDAGRSGPCGGWRAATWADGIVLVARADVAGLAAARRLADEMAPLGLTWRFAVREIPGGFKAAEAADRLGRGDVLRIGHERSLAAGLAHGLAPGDRSVGPLAAAARAVTAAERGTATPEAAPCGQRHRAARGPLRFRRRSWGPAPAFNPAAFAEEW